MKNMTTFDAAATPVRSTLLTGAVAGARCPVAPVPTVKGTGLPVGGPSYRTRLPFAGGGVPSIALGIDVVLGADQVSATDVRMPAAAARGIPPRRTPSRC